MEKQNLPSYHGIFRDCRSQTNSTAIENLVQLRTLKRCFNRRSDMEIDNFVDTIKDRIQSVILTAIVIIFIPNIDLAFKSTNASSEQDSASVIEKSVGNT